MTEADRAAFDDWWASHALAAGISEMREVANAAFLAGRASREAASDIDLRLFVSDASAAHWVGGPGLRMLEDCTRDFRAALARLGLELVRV